MPGPFHLTTPPATPPAPPAAPHHSPDCATGAGPQPPVV